MLSEYDKSERAQMLRDARAKDELERATIKIAARKEGLEEGEAIGVEKATCNMVKTMYQNGMEKELIAKMTGLDINTVEEYLK